MTCASCANRIERKLNKLDGVTATVNYATEKAKVTFPADVTPEDLVDDGRAGRVRRRSAARRRLTRTTAVGRRPDAVAAPAAAGLDRPDRAGDRDGDGPGAAVHLLAVAVADARRAGRRLGRLAVPPRRLGQPAARHVHDGHADLARHARRAGLVGLRAVLGHGRHAGHDPPVRAHRRAHRRRRQHLPRGRRRGHHVHPGRPLLRGPVQAPGRRRAARPARAGRQGRRRAPRRPDGPIEERIPTDAADRGHAVRRPARREDRHRRRRSRRAPRRSTPPCSPASPCRSRSAPATRSSAPPSTPAAGSSSAPPGSAPTPSSPRWPGSSRTPRTARPRSSGWPTGSPGSSSRS